MDSATTTNQQVQTLYEQCDPGGRGYITRGDLNCLQGHVPLDDAQLDELFAILDKGQQGQLTLEEFTKGFETELCAEHGFLNPGQFLGQTVKPLEMITAGESDHDSDTQLDQVMQATGAGILLKDYDQVGRIWKELRQVNPSLLPEFEKMLASIATEIRTVRTEYENMESMIRTKFNRQEEHLGQLLEDLEQQMTQERERLLEEERSKERKLRETLTNELRQKENMSNELLQQYEQARTRLDELEKARMDTIQEKDRLQQEKVKLEKCLADKESALNECKEYIEMLQKKAREDRRTRAKAAIELSENIALEREDLVRQLDTLR
ncbi:Ras and EF-hand domain-containing protein [Fasciola gigantica]|uniref:Ras and EF-hand domain-containing protein n=1 Tax=Fasciola gigantica TaxID=46835 RepID=A0A504YB06_FASGI|nr:Ras and EF-hand domain-containing protein [Fasciola gigantica]